MSGTQLVARLVVATSNPGKVAEIRAALEGAGLDVVGFDAAAVARMGAGGAEAFELGEVEETGATFEENARIKAEAYSTRTDLPVLADDSGIEVDALGGEPGVLSARYGGPDRDDAGRNELLLANLRGVPDDKRTARFRCVLAVARAGSTLATFEGVVEGRIAHAPQGEEGFGYDPVFFHEEIGTTFGMISREHKQRLSHRGQALARFVEALRSGRLVL